MFALIPAAGSGARMGTSVPKQYCRLGGQTMLEHAIDALLAAPDLEQVLVVVAPEDIAHGALFLASDYASWISGQVLSIDGGK